MVLSTEAMAIVEVRMAKKLAEIAVTAKEAARPEAESGATSTAIRMAIEATAIVATRLVALASVAIRPSKVEEQVEQVSVAATEQEQESFMAVIVATQ